MSHEPAAQPVVVDSKLFVYYTDSPDYIDMPSVAHYIATIPFSAVTANVSPNVPCSVDFY